VRVSLLLANFRPFSLRPHLHAIELNCFAVQFWKGVTLDSIVLPKVIVLLCGFGLVLVGYPSLVRQLLSLLFRR